jgi:hypothetical protein
MNWKEIRKNKEIYRLVNVIWQTEQSLPRFFRNANSIWTNTKKAFRRFCFECSEIWGLFDDAGKFLACVYVERQNSLEVFNIHLSIVEKIKPSVFIRESAELRNIFLRRGIKIIRGWILQKNFALCKILCEIGFKKTSLTMKYGESHGQVLRWQMVELRRG